MNGQVAAFGRLAWVEGKLFARDPLTLVFTVLFPVLVIVVLGAAFGSTPASPDAWRGLPAMDFYVPAYLGLTLAAMGLIGIPIHVAAYHEQGVLRRFRAAGTPVWMLVAAQALVGILGTIPGAVILVTIGLLGYDVRAPHSVLGVLLAFLLSAVAFACIGVLIGALMPGVRAAQGLGLALFFVMMFVSGTAPPREVLPRWMNLTGDVLPLTHMVTTLVEPWAGFGVGIAELAGVAGMGVAAALLAGTALRRVTGRR